MDKTPHSLLFRLARHPPAERPTDWERFVELFTPLMYHWASRLGLPMPDALDLVQDVFVVLLRKLPEFEVDKERSFRGWLRTILDNRWRDMCRRRVPPSALDPDRMQDFPDRNGADDVADGEYRRHLVQRALRLMKRDFNEATWQACWRTKVDGRPAAEVAAELGMTLAAVHAATYRILHRLRLELA